MFTLEEAKKFLLRESVSENEVNSAINGKYKVVITYSDEMNRAPRERTIEPYVYGLSKAGNQVIRAYQYYGDTFRGVPKWKLFRLDRITSWNPTSDHFVLTPRENGWNAEEYNRNGDGSMSSIFNQVKPDKNIDGEDTLSVLRAKTERMKNSKPINIYDKETGKYNYYKSGPILSKDNSNEKEAYKSGPLA